MGPFIAYKSQTDCLIIHTENVNENDVYVIEEIWNVKKKVAITHDDILKNKIKEKIFIEDFSKESTCVVIVVLGELSGHQSDIILQLRKILKCDQLFVKPKLIIGRVYPPKIQSDAVKPAYSMSSEANFISLWTSCENDGCNCGFIQILLKEIKEADDRHPISYIMRRTIALVMAVTGENHSWPFLTSSLLNDLIISINGK